jgi:hypothetical protein
MFLFPRLVKWIKFHDTISTYNGLYGNIVGQISILACLHVFILLALYIYLNPCSTFNLWLIKLLFQSPEFVAKICWFVYQTILSCYPTTHAILEASCIYMVVWKLCCNSLPKRPCKIQEIEVSVLLNTLQNDPVAIHVGTGMTLTHPTAHRKSELDQITWLENTSCSMPSRIQYSKRERGRGRGRENNAQQDPRCMVIPTSSAGTASWTTH